MLNIVFHVVNDDSGGLLYMNCKQIYERPILLNG